MTAPIQTIVLDLDFCLADTNKMRPALGTVFEAFFNNQKSFEQYAVKDLVDRAWSTAPHDLVTELGCAPEVGEAFLDFYRTLAPTGLELYSDVWDVLEELQRRGVRMFLVTKGVERFQCQKVESLHIAPFFEEITYVGPDSKIKSKAMAMSDLLVRHQLHPATVWVVGDSNDELTAGRELGATTVQTLRPGVKEQLACYRVTDLCTLPKLLP